MQEFWLASTTVRRHKYHLNCLRFDTCFTRIFLSLGQRVVFQTKVVNQSAARASAFGSRSRRSERAGYIVCPTTPPDSKVGLPLMLSYGSIGLLQRSQRQQVLLTLCLNQYGTRPVRPCGHQPGWGSIHTAFSHQ